MDEVQAFPAIIRSLSTDDLLEVVKIHSAAFPDSGLTKLGSEAVRRYYAWQLLGPHDAVALGCDYHGSFAGFCFAGIYNGAMSGFLNKNRNFLLWRMITHPWLLTNDVVRRRSWFGVKILRRSRPVPRGMHQVDSSRPFGILSIAVHPRFQGAGLGRLMMDFAEEHAQRNGFHKMQLSVNVSNFQAIRFYELLGWEKVIYNTTWEGMMVKRIDHE